MHRLECARTRLETDKGSGRYHTVTRTVEWDPKKTALVVCDMWDKHWCPGATQRVGEMAPRMNEVLKAARNKGVLIIHCPSDTMDFYKDTPQRKLAWQAPRVEAKVPLQGWCRLDPKREPPLPIDDADGGYASQDHELLAIDEALTLLAAEDPRAAQLIQLRHFAGLSVEDAAEVAGISRSTAYEHWAYARARLRCLLEGE